MLKGLVATLVLALLSIVADVCLKHAARYPTLNSRWFWSGLALYAAAAFATVVALRALKFGAFAGVYSSVMLISLVAIGHFGFAERLSRREWLGVGLALASIALLAKPE